MLTIVIAVPARIHGLIDTVYLRTSWPSTNTASGINDGSSWWHFILASKQKIKIIHLFLRQIPMNAGRTDTHVTVNITKTANVGCYY